MHGCGGKHRASPGAVQTGFGRGKAGRGSVYPYLEYDVFAARENHAARSSGACKENARMNAAAHAAQCARCPAGLSPGLRPVSDPEPKPTGDTSWLLPKRR